MQAVAQTGCHIAIVQDLPYYGLMIPAEQGPNHLAAPLILMSGDRALWQDSDSLALFVGVHEGFHVLQDREKILNVPSIAAVKHRFSSDILTDLQAECTIITERAADVAATISCLTIPQRGIQCMNELSAEPSLDMLMTDCANALTGPGIDQDYLERTINIDSIDVAALRYYAHYLKNNFGDASCPKVNQYSTIQPDSTPSTGQAVRQNASLLYRCLPL